VLLASGELPAEDRGEGGDRGEGVPVLPPDTTVWLTAPTA